jgi:CheY-like chemotaxis protein
MSNPKKILLVEDEVFITELYLLALRKRGFEVDAVIDGLEALQKAQSNQYDIILLDLMIPGLNGINVLDKIKQNNQIKAKVIIATNLEERKDIKEEIEKKADGYLLKANLTPSELADFIDKIQ